MKKLLASLLLGLFLVVGLTQPSQATLAYSSAFTTFLTNGWTVQNYSALITATANDTTATVKSPTITNRSADVREITAGVTATNQTGTSPTLTLQLMASFDNTNFFQVQSKQGATAGTLANVVSPTLGISTASSTNVATGFNTECFGLSDLAFPYYQIWVVVGGTGTPGGTYTVSAAVKRVAK